MRLHDSSCSSFPAQLGALQPLVRAPPVSRKPSCGILVEPQSAQLDFSMVQECQEPVSLISKGFIILF